MIKRGTIGWTIWNVIESIILFAGGLVCCIFAYNKDFQNAAFIIAGAIVLVDAGLRMLLEVINIFSFDDKVAIKIDYQQAILGSLEIAVGVILIRIGNSFNEASEIFQFVGIFLGTLLITAGSIFIVHSALYLVKKANSIAENIFTIIAGCMVIVLGALTIVFLTKKENLVPFSLIFFGICLMLLGVILFVVTIIILRTAKRLKKELNATIEAEEKANEEAVKKEEAIEVKENKVEEKVEEKPAEDKPVEEKKSTKAKKEKKAE